MMDLETALLTATSTFGISMAGAYWLSKTLIGHRLTRALEDHKTELLGRIEEKKAQLQGELGKEKAQVEGAVKREVELQLGERAAQRQYEYEARKRLYLAIGPLRFQLLLACRDCAGRIEAHGLRERYKMDLNGYYGRSSLYRLLRPLAVTELIEREIAYSDFTVDASALDCLRFRKAALRSFSSEEVVCDHPQVDWQNQVQHAFVDSLTACVQVLIREGTRGVRVVRFGELQTDLDSSGLDILDPFASLLADFNLHTRPIMWIRLVTYGHLCNAFVTAAGAQLGFEAQTFSTRELVLAGGDRHYGACADRLMENIGKLERIAL